jgi:hypothetical protein
MNLKQLYTRLDRITRIDKLDAFISVASEFRYFNLEEAAMKKSIELQGKNPSNNPQTIVVGKRRASKSVPAVSKQTIPETPKILRRLIEF